MNKIPALSYIEVLRPHFFYALSTVNSLFDFQWSFISHLTRKNFSHYLEHSLLEPPTFLLPISQIKYMMDSSASWSTVSAKLNSYLLKFFQNTSLLAKLELIYTAVHVGGTAWLSHTHTCTHLLTYTKRKKDRVFYSSRVMVS